MKTNSLALWGVVSVLVFGGVFCASSEGFGGKNSKRPAPSAMHYSNYGNNGFGINPYAGYSPNVQMINPRSGPTPFQYRQWYARAFEETTGIPAPIGGYRLGRTVPSVGRIYRNEMGIGGGSHFVRPGIFIVEEVGSVLESGYAGGVSEKTIYSTDTISENNLISPAIPVESDEMDALEDYDYAPAQTDGSYNQQFVGDGCFDVCYDPCFDPCAMPCFAPCPPMTVPVAEKKHCLLSGIKSFFSHIFHQKSFCASSKLTTDPWFGATAYYSHAPMVGSWSGSDFGDYNYYDGGYADGSYSGGTSSSCCGGGDSSFTGGESYSNSYDGGYSDNGLGVDVNSAPAPAAKPAPGPLPMIDTSRANGTTYPAIPVPDTRPNPASALPPANPATTPAAPGSFGVPAAVPTVPSPLPGNTGVIRMMVPEDSVVYINGYQTKLSGVERNFTANNLVDGEVYDFEIRVVAMNNGQFNEQVKITTLIGGKTAALAFMEYDTTYRAIASR